MTEMKVGLIGLGNMGGRLAKRMLECGVELSVFDVNPEAVEELGKLGAVVESSPLELAKKNECVITVLPNADIVKSVVLGQNGLIHGLKPGSTLIDMTSSVPKITKEIGAQLREKQIDMLDAPVSGGVKKAEDGTLSIMVGGEEPVFKNMLPLLRHMGSNIMHVGELGSGHTIKALNNLLCATTLAATAEALAIGVKMGLDPSKMLGVINTSSGRSHSSEIKFPQQVLSRKFEVGFTIDLMTKDLSIAMDIAEEAETPATVAESVFELWQQAVESGAGNMDHTAITKVIEEKAGVEIKG
jgi:3-hydroxyisobutyrate dehydrogenase